MACPRHDLRSLPQWLRRGLRRPVESPPTVPEQCFPDGLSLLLVVLIVIGMRGGIPVDLLLEIGQLSADVFQTVFDPVDLPRRWRAVLQC